VKIKEVEVKEEKKDEEEQPLQKILDTLTEDELKLLDENLRKLKVSVEKPEDADTWFDIGTTLSDRGLYEDAIRCFDKTLRYMPQHRYAWNAKAQCLMKLGRTKEAVMCYKKSLELGIARSRTSIDDLLEIVGEEKKYDIELLDKALATIIPDIIIKEKEDFEKELEEIMEKKEEEVIVIEQPQCPVCDSFKVKVLPDKTIQCLKCGKKTPEKLEKEKLEEEAWGEILPLPSEPVKEEQPQCSSCGSFKITTLPGGEIQCSRCGFIEVKEKEKPPKVEPVKEEPLPPVEQQPRCPICRSFKIKKGPDGFTRCMKCGYIIG
jgi:tetratricopeptide (TPR) repeat protein